MLDGKRPLKIYFLQNKYVTVIARTWREIIVIVLIMIVKMLIAMALAVTVQNHIIEVIEVIAMFVVNINVDANKTFVQIKNQ